MSSSRSIRRVVLGAMLCIALVVFIAGPAAAHVEIDPKSVPRGSTTSFSFQVPNEKDNASTVAMEVTFPTDIPFRPSACSRSRDWTFAIEKAPLPKPIKTEEVAADAPASSHPGRGVVSHAGLIGWRLARDDHPGRGSADAGFLTDMQTHHLQALELGYAYLEHGTDPTLQHIAHHVIADQGIEVGQMRTVLSEWGLPSTPDPEGTAMAWMHEPHPAQQMPGMATPADVDRLRNARGLEADDLFSQLMIRHHEGGIHMADFAATDAQSSNIRNFARGMAASQRSEIGEINAVGQRLGLAPVLQ